MGAVPERQVVGGVGAGEVEPVGAAEDGRVTVGCIVRRDDEFALADGDAVDGDVGGSTPATWRYFAAGISKK